MSPGPEVLHSLIVARSGQTPRVPRTIQERSCFKRGPDPGQGGTNHSLLFPQPLFCPYLCTLQPYQHPAFPFFSECATNWNILDWRQLHREKGSTEDKEGPHMREARQSFLALRRWKQSSFYTDQPEPLSTCWQSHFLHPDFLQHELLMDPHHGQCWALGMTRLPILPVEAKMGLLAQEVLNSWPEVGRQGAEPGTFILWMATIAMQPYDSSIAFLLHPWKYGKVSAERL